MVRSIIVLLIALVVVPAACAQKQLVLLKKEKVVLRLYPGDDIVFKKKGRKTIWTSYVNNLADTAVVIHADTIPFRTIDRVYFKQTKFYNVLGTALVIGGAGYFLIDQFNVTVVQGDKASLDKGVNRVSIPALVMGLPLMLIHKKSQRLGHKYRLMTVKPGSVFYQPDPKGFESPYIPGSN